MKKRAPLRGLTDGIHTGTAWANAVYVSNGDVYVAGLTPRLWKNGSLLDSATYAVAENVSSMFLYNNTDLYFSGASSVWGLNGYWLNGHFVEMDPGCRGLSNSCVNTLSNQTVAIYVK